jgi:hypothetical protein
MCKRCRCITPAQQLRWFGGCTVGALLCVSVALCVASFGYSALQEFITNQIVDTFILKSPSSSQFPPFMDSDNPDAGSVISTFYVYNVTNPEQILEGHQPIVEEIGPLVYSYHNKKYNASWSSDGGLLSYMQYQYYLRLSGENFDTNLTTLNMPLLAALNIPAADWLIYKGSKFTREMKSLFIQRTAEEVLFGWHNDPLLSQLSKELKELGVNIGLPTSYGGVQVCGHAHIFYAVLVKPFLPSTPNPRTTTHLLKRRWPPTSPP